MQVDQELLKACKDQKGLSSLYFILTFTRRCGPVIVWLFRYQMMLIKTAPFHIKLSRFKVGLPTSNDQNN